MYMDDNYIVNRIINILENNNQNLLLGNINSPRPGSICQVSTDYGIKEAYNINCTYPGDAIVIWDKDEEQYYCFTDKPSEVISSRQLSYRKRKDTEKLLKPLYVILCEKKVDLPPVDGSFYIYSTQQLGAGSGRIADYSGGLPMPQAEVFTNNGLFTYPSTITGNFDFSATNPNDSIITFSISLFLSNVGVNATTAILNINGGASISDTDIKTIQVDFRINAASSNPTYRKISTSGTLSIAESTPITIAAHSSLQINLNCSCSSSGIDVAVMSGSISFSIVGVEYALPTNLYLYSSNTNKVLNVYDTPITSNKLVAYSITALKNKILLTIKDEHTTRFNRIIQRIYDYSLNLKEENIYIFNNTVSEDIDNWLSIYNVSYNTNPTLPAYIAQNLDFVSNLLDTLLIQAEISDEDKKLIATESIKIPVKLYDIITNPYSKELKATKTLKLKKIKKATLLALSIYKLS